MHKIIEMIENRKRTKISNCLFFGIFVSKMKYLRAGRGRLP
jgi:hypothetical protein